MKHYSSELLVADVVGVRNGMCGRRNPVILGIIFDADAFSYHDVVDRFATISTPWDEAFHTESSGWVWRFSIARQMKLHQLLDSPRSSDEKFKLAIITRI
jgi:hypothetical protein